MVGRRGRSWHASRLPGHPRGRIAARQRAVDVGEQRRVNPATNRTDRRGQRRHERRSEAAPDASERRRRSQRVLRVPRAHVCPTRAVARDDGDGAGLGHECPDHRARRTAGRRRAGARRRPGPVRRARRRRRRARRAVPTPVAPRAPSAAPSRRDRPRPRVHSSRAGCLRRRDRRASPRRAPRRLVDPEPPARAAGEEDPADAHRISGDRRRASVRPRSCSLPTPAGGGRGPRWHRDRQRRSTSSTRAASPVTAERATCTWSTASTACGRACSAATHAARFRPPTRSGSVIAYTASKSAAATARAYPIATSAGRRSLVRARPRRPARRTIARIRRDHDPDVMARPASIPAASSKSQSDSPPRSWVDRRRRTVRHRMSTSG